MLGAPTAQRVLQVFGQKRVLKAGPRPADRAEGGEELVVRHQDDLTRTGLAELLLVPGGLDLLQVSDVVGDLEQIVVVVAGIHAFQLPVLVPQAEKAVFLDRGVRDSQIELGKDRIKGPAPAVVVVIAGDRIDRHIPPVLPVCCLIGPRKSAWHSSKVPA